MIKASGAGHWPGCCGGQVGSCSAGWKWKWVRKEEKGEKNWMAGQFFQHSRIFFPFSQHFSSQRSLPFSECGESTPTGRLSLCPEKCPTPQPAPNDIFYSRPFNNLGSDYFLLLQLICCLRAAKDDEVKLSAVRLKGMGFSLLGSFWMSREERKIDGL